GQAWYQVEITIFSNEDPAGRREENWSASDLNLAYPPQLSRFEHLLDLLLIDELIPPPAVDPDLLLQADSLDLSQQADPQLNPQLNPQLQLQLQRLRETGPQPLRADPDFRFFDLARDPFLLLPNSLSDFQQTNRALERDASHRVLFAGRWRQPMPDPAQATPIYIEGGINYGDFHELQGTITLRFNDNRDRVVIDVDLWLSELGFAADDAAPWPLPPRRPDLAYPTVNAVTNLLPDESVQRIYQFVQSREMRSDEFHYLDHPAMGIIIMVEPYEVPELEFPFTDPFAPRQDEPAELIQ
ncbi:MAG: CsiV family protein, partial [Gammaproteobacteria bacterium]